MTTPAKYIKINGVLKLNPAYTQWREAQENSQPIATPVYTANTPQQQQQQDGLITVKAELVGSVNSAEEEHEYNPMGSYGNKYNHIHTNTNGYAHNSAFPASNEYTSVSPYGSENKEQIIMNKKRRLKRKRGIWTVVGGYGGAIVGAMILAPIFPVGFLLGGAAGAKITHAAHKQHEKKKIKKLERKLAAGIY